MSGILAYPSEARVQAPEFANFGYLHEEKENLCAAQTWILRTKDRLAWSGCQAVTAMISPDIRLFTNHDTDPMAMVRPDRPI